MEDVIDNEVWVERTAKMLDRLSPSALERMYASGYSQSNLTAKEYAVLLRQARDGDVARSLLGWFRLLSEKYLEEAIDVVQSHPVIRKALSEAKDNYLGVAILSTGFGGHDLPHTIERILEGAVRRMLVSDALTAAQDMDRILILGQAGELPGYECTIVHGMKLTNRMEIAEAISAIPYKEAKSEGLTGAFSRSSVFNPDFTSVLVREFRWGPFLQSDSNAPMYTPVFRRDVNLVKLVGLFAVATARPLSMLYEYRCVPQWIQDFGYPAPTDYAMYDFAARAFFGDETVSQNEFENFKSLWLLYKAYGENRLSMERAVEHLSRALSRHGRLALQDKILDTAIALETVYTADTHTEITYRLSTRAAFFLGGNSDERAEVSRKVREFYNVRSRLAHGSSQDNEKLNAAWHDGFDIAQRTLKKLLAQGEAPDWDDLVMSAGES